MSFKRTIHHPRENSLECMACGATLELFRRTAQNPHRLLEARESFEAQHRNESTCALYGYSQDKRTALRVLGGLECLP